MTYRVQDVIGFPPPTPPPKTITIADLVSLADSSVTYPVAYSFGGNAPTEIDVRALSLMQNKDSKQVYNYGRMFAEDRAYYWNPLSPDYNGLG